jgi:tetratricopeptide (TPR) repeat protein
MTARTRVALAVAVASAAAAALAVGVALVQRNDGADAETRPSGSPPLVLELGVRSDPEADALRRAAELYDDGRQPEAARIFARYGSPDARVGAALARWPGGTVRALERLVRRYPDRALPRLHLGLALFWQGRRVEAVAAWRGARRIEPDSPSAVRAGDLLFPNAARGLPVFVPSFEAPASLAHMRPDRQFAVLERAARRRDVRAKLLYGVALQRVERPLSARRQYDAAVAIAPDDPEALVAAAVARFDKERPGAAFARLGPLSRRFPESVSVRFHLGLLLLWLGEESDGRRQLERARDLDPSSPHAREATRFLQRLAGIGTGSNSD